MVVVRAEADRQPEHIPGVLIPTPAPALGRIEEVDQQPLAFTGRGLGLHRGAQFTSVISWLYIAAVASPSPASSLGGKPPGGSPSFRARTP